MTVCIVARCFKEKSFVAVTDELLSTGAMSVEGAHKFRAIGSKWLTLIAGNDLSPLTPIVRAVDSRVPEIGESLGIVIDELTRAYAEQLNRKAERIVLASQGWQSLAEFRQHGLQQLGPEIFSRVLYEVERQKLELTFLVFGFDAGEAFIFTVENPGVESHFETSGFWAVGSGQTSALGYLFGVNDLVYLPLSDVLYHLCAAKFQAEPASGGSPGVGLETIVLVLREDGTRYYLTTEALAEVRAVWAKDKESRRLLPKQATEAAMRAIEAARSKGGKRTQLASGTAG